MTTNITHPQFETQNLAPRHLIILPTPHEDTLRLKEKLLTFSDRGWKVRDFGAFGAFEWVSLSLRLKNSKGTTILRETSAVLLSKASNMSILSISCAGSNT